MGGNALSVPSVRLSARSYAQLDAELHSKLKAAYPALNFATVQSYRSKADFGDSLGAVEVVSNGPVTSFGLLVDTRVLERTGNLFQVDFIKVAAEEFDYAQKYLAFNDLGNLVGRIAHKMGLAHKHDGLYFYVRDGDYLFREILLTRDYDKALTVMGFSPARFALGFDEPADLFEYTASTPFFSVDIFLLDNRNAKSRVRDRKRKTYMDFLDWCEKSKALGQFEFPKEKAEWLPRLYEHFPAFRGEYESALSDLARSREVKVKFNGALVAQWTGLAGKELGMLMKRFRETFDSQDALHVHILRSDQLDLKSQLIEMSNARLQ